MFRRAFLPAACAFLMGLSAAAQAAPQAVPDDAMGPLQPGQCWASQCPLDALPVQKAPSSPTENEDIELPPNFTYSVAADGKKYIQCSRDCPDGYTSIRWDYQDCLTLPECRALLDQFRKDASQEPADEKASKNAGSYAQEIAAQNEAAIAAGWTTCADPRTAGAMDCRDYLAQKNASKGFPNGKSPFRTKTANPGESPIPGFEEAWPMGDAGGDNPAAREKAGPDSNAGIIGVEVLMDPKVFDTIVNFSPYLAAHPVANIGVELPKTEILVNQRSSQILPFVKDAEKGGGTLFDNRDRGLPTDAGQRGPNTRFFGQGPGERR